jgi:hypothetical protein
MKPRLTSKFVLVHRPGHVLRVTLGRCERAVASAQIDADAGHIECLHPLLTGMFIR